MLRKIYGTLYNKKIKKLERRHNNELQELYGRPNILSYMRSKRLERLGHVWRWRVDSRIIKQTLMVEMRGLTPLGRSRTRWRVMKDLRVIQKRAQIDIVYNRE